MLNFVKIVCPGKVEVSGYKRLQPIYCKIEYKDGRLSITGVVGLFRGGNCAGGCGQIVEELSNIEDLDVSMNWTINKIKLFICFWKEWHLNDMKADCDHQRADKWEDVRIDHKELPKSTANRDSRGIMAIWVYEGEHKDGLLNKPCQVCGYRYGSSWLKVEVPEDVLEWLYNLPDSVTKPVWV
jgi:hypothetical protein